MVNVESNKWDPLERQLTSELVSATVKRQIKNILKSYTGWFDPFSELIQNSLDALESRKKKEPGFKPKLWISINLKDNVLSITDNGIGFAEDQFKAFLAPNVSFKKQDNRGNKGVGATYLAYGFNFLQIGTKHPDYKFIGNIQDGREWVEDETGTVPRPKVAEDKYPLHNEFNQIDRGSTFTLKLSGKYIRPKKLNWLGATKAEQWLAILKLKTPLGGVYLNSTKPDTECYLSICDESGNVTTSSTDCCEYLYPNTVISTCVSLADIRATQKRLMEEGRDVSKLPSNYSKLNGLFNYWKAEDFLTEGKEFYNKLDPEQNDLIRNYNINCYGFFCYTTKIWDEYNDTILAIRKGERILKGGLQLSTNSMPQGDLILIPLTKNIGYQHVAHVVVHFDQADPDLGRKGFQPELEALGKHISVLILNLFYGWRHLLKGDTGAPPDIIHSKNIHDWIKELEKYEVEHPLIIKRKDLFLPLMEPSITANPLNEQDVIALFNQLLAGGVIRGIKLMATSQHNQYDGVFRFSLNEPFENHIFDKENNPLGVERSMVKDYLSEPRILEYKYSVDALIEEFEKEIKKERDIELVVAWTLGSNWKHRYEIVPLLHFDNLHHRYFHGGTHLIKNPQTGDTVFPAIILSELIDYINDPVGVQDHQKKQYVDF